MQNLVLKQRGNSANQRHLFFAPLLPRHCHRAIIFYFSATATCATFFSSCQWRGGAKRGAKSGASAQQCLQLLQNIKNKICFGVDFQAFPMNLQEKCPHFSQCAQHTHFIRFFLQFLSTVPVPTTLQGLQFFIFSISY